jgi:DNA-binding NarL/FixJ family response regulator
MQTTQASRHLSVAVASDQSLVTESVRAALSGRGLEVAALPWPGRSDAPPPSVPEPFDVGLLMSDLDRWPRVSSARALIADVSAPWVVLTSAPEGPLWGAVLEAGATLVMPATVGLGEVTRVLPDVARGRASVPSGQRLEHVARWAELLVQRQVVTDRLRSLTRREREVLRLLYAGESVAGIAELLEVSPATVRSQVKSVLRKLAVTSQLAAVAAVGNMLEPEFPGTADLASLVGAL